MDQVGLEAKVGYYMCFKASRLHNEKSEKGEFLSAESELIKVYFIPNM